MKTIFWIGQAVIAIGLAITGYIRLKMITETELTINEVSLVVVGFLAVVEILLYVTYHLDSAEVNVGKLALYSFLIAFTVAFAITFGRSFLMKETVNIHLTLLNWIARYTAYFIPFTTVLVGLIDNESNDKLLNG